MLINVNIIFPLEEKDFQIESQSKREKQNKNMGNDTAAETQSVCVKGSCP